MATRRVCDVCGQEVPAFWEAELRLSEQACGMPKATASEFSVTMHPPEGRDVCVACGLRLLEKCARAAHDAMPVRQDSRNAAAMAVGMENRFRRAVDTFFTPADAAAAQRAPKP